MSYKIEIEAPEIPYPGGTEQGYPVGGSNVTRAVIDLLLSVAKAMEEQAPRIPEPGLWGVVEAGVKQHDARCHWINLGGHWRPDDTDEYDRMWGDLIDPVLVREGVSE
jgi:hypothetical protein